MNPVAAESPVKVKELFLTAFYSGGVWGQPGEAMQYIVQRELDFKRLPGNFSCPYVLSWWPRPGHPLPEQCQQAGVPTGLATVMYGGGVYQSTPAQYSSQARGPGP